MGETTISDLPPKFELKPEVFLEYQKDIEYEAGLNLDEMRGWADHWLDKTTVAKFQNEKQFAWSPDALFDWALRLVKMEDELVVGENELSIATLCYMHVGGKYVHEVNFVQETIKEKGQMKPEELAKYRARGTELMEGWYKNKKKAIEKAFLGNLTLEQQKELAYQQSAALLVLDPQDGFEHAKELVQDFSRAIASRNQS